MILTPKNWNSFQHYKDRSPAWIKLHRGLLDNFEYYRLSPEAGKWLPLIWLVASDKDGELPNAADLAFRLRISETLAADILAELTERGFLVYAEPGATPAQPDATLAQRIATSNGFGSRHISDAVKRAVWLRDGGKCCACGSDEHIEYDHKIPVSKGGSSEEGNIQLLCRTCNRRKRTRLATPAQPSAEPRGEREKKEKEADTRSKDRPARAPKPIERQIDLEEAIAEKAKKPDPSAFDAFWQAYPRREGPNPRKPAETRFNSLVKSGVDPQMMIAEAKKLYGAESARGNLGTRFIPQAVTWLNQARWSDHAAIAFLMETQEMPIEQAVKMFAKIGVWSKYAGPAPGLSGCRASAELLAAHGLGPDGRKLDDVMKAAVIA